MRTYHVGILGSGVISRTYLADIQKFYHELQVTACADLDPGRAQALAASSASPKPVRQNSCSGMTPLTSSST